MELRDAWLGSGNSLLCARLHVAPREWAAQHGSREDPGLRNCPSEPGVRQPASTHPASSSGVFSRPSLGL